jgi:hypothetical protein
MRFKISVPLDDAIAARARVEAEARGMSLEAYLSDLVVQHLPPGEPTVKGNVSGIFGLVKDGEPTDIARDKDKLIGEAAWQEHLEETKPK